MLLIGITGGIASGKSTVDGMLLDLGAAPVIDADRTVHDLYRRDPEVRATVVGAFGAGILAADGAIDRKALGAIVFGDPAALRRLEGIIHPAVRQTIRRQLDALPDDAVAVVDAVKLLEGELGALAHTVWWVTATPEQQLQRLRDRGMGESQARARLAAQPSLDAWRSRVDLLIDNSGRMEDTRRHVSLAYRNALAAHHPGSAGR